MDRRAGIVGSAIRIRQLTSSKLGADGRISEALSGCAHLRAACTATSDRSESDAPLGEILALHPDRNPGDQRGPGGCARASLHHRLLSSVPPGLPCLAPPPATILGPCRDGSICLAALTMAGNGLKRAKVLSTSQHGGWHVRLRAKSRFLPLCHNVATPTGRRCPWEQGSKDPQPQRGLHRCEIRSRPLRRSCGIRGC